MKLGIYIPRPGTPAAARISPKSAVVAAIDAQPQIFHFEGNLYGAENLEKFTERLLSAAGRLVQRYPTTAIAAFPVEQMELIALYDASTYTITKAENPAKLTEWSGEPLDALIGDELPLGRTSTQDPAIKIAFRSARSLGQQGRKIAFRALSGQILVVDQTSTTFVTVMGADEDWKIR